MRGWGLRTRSVLAVVATTALVAAGGAAWAWSLGGSGTGSASAATVVELKLSARPDPKAPLRPGVVTDLSVTVRNDNLFPIRVTAIRPGSGPTQVDQAHRDAGCLRSGVSLTRQGFGVSWRVPAGASRGFVISEAIQMTNDSDNACQGATFTVPLSAGGVNDDA
ncbi:hypothetical protein KZ829_05760 [Actinoplanes hulinensis]|uniref:Uncharacterized protein n=1 Tax=Actinoplanes hulinensis TaxID=1144547 RepID=A0ABS7AXF9_9ACTN|nr:hypothetical protein [Actinoplanes hulinensis]MBW6433249.1 hypothetical protein [Actinoplanes hulinensis]